VGFNIAAFDLPFITARSFINDVAIVPFMLKNVIDLRDKINAYRFSPTRGRLAEFAALMDREYEEEGTPDLCIAKDVDQLRTNLARDLTLIDELYEKAKQTKVIEITRW
jgi:hypothetical protein